MNNYNDVGVLCVIPTHNRYMTLAAVMTSVALQSRVPDRMLVVDSSVESAQVYGQTDSIQGLNNLLDSRGCKVEWATRPAFGPHDAHQYSQSVAKHYGCELIWRIDDDAIPEADCLRRLLQCMSGAVGAVGPLVLNNHPSLRHEHTNLNRIDDVGKGHSVQRCLWQGQPLEVEHLVLSFLYRAGVVDYNLELSRLGVTEETQFTYDLFRAGYKVVVNPSAIVWHLMQPTGGIRDCGDDAQRAEMAAHDNAIFQRRLEEWRRTPPQLRE